VEFRSFKKWIGLLGVHCRSRNCKEKKITSSGTEKYTLTYKHKIYVVINTKDKVIHQKVKPHTLKIKIILYVIQSN